MGFPLVDNKPGSDTRLVSIDRNISIYLLPLLDQVLDSESFVTVGNVSADLVRVGIEELEEQLFSNSVGTVLSTLGSVPENGLPCDGQYYAKEDYPELYQALPGRLKDLAGFWVPDMTMRMIVGGSDRGNAGGEETHTLTVAEMPAHTHSVHTHLPGELGGELANPVPEMPIPAESGSAGLGLPHNNMPPYLVMTFYIVAR